MRSDLLVLESELSEVSALIDSYQRAEALYPKISALGGEHAEIVDISNDLAKGRTSQRKYQYISVIIALYGAMEQYVESLILSYARLVPVICGRFGNIPEAIRIKHHELSVDYLSEIKMNRVHEPEDTHTIVRRLSMCRIRATKYELNNRAFTLRTSNMSFDRVKTLSANISVVVSPRRLVNSQSYQSFYSEKTGGLEPALGDAEARSAFSFVDDLVAKRNRIAHGANSVDDIEDYPLLLDRIAELRMYGRALHEIFEDHAIRLAVKQARASVLGVPLHKYKGNIVCFPLETGEIRVGDVVFMLPTDENIPVRRGEALSLRVGNGARETVSGAPGANFGVKLPYNPSQTASYGILPVDVVEKLNL